MVTLIVSAAAIWILGSIAAGVGVGRVIARADVNAESARYVRDERHLVSH